MKHIANHFKEYAEPIISVIILIELCTLSTNSAGSVFYLGSNAVAKQIQNIKCSMWKGEKSSVKVECCVNTKLKVYRTAGFN